MDGSRGFVLETRDKVQGQCRNVFKPVSKRRRSNAQDVQAKVQIFAEASVCYGLPEIAIACGDQPDIDLNGFPAAEPFDFAFFDRAKQLRLERNILLTLGEIKGELVEVRKQNERISRLEQWQTRLKVVLAAVCACLS